MLTLVPRDRLIGILAGPVLWALYFALSYLGSGLACSLDWGRQTVAGLSAVQWLLLVVGLVISLVIIAAMLQARKGRHRAKAGPASDEARREEFFYVTALTLGGLSLVGNAWLALAAVLAPVC